VKPHPVVVTLLTQVEELIPKWKIVPTKDVIDSAFKDPVKREKVSVVGCVITSMLLDDLISVPFDYNPISLSYIVRVRKTKLA
jgi:hypothetical protein